MGSFRRLRAVLAVKKNDHPALLQKAKAVHHGLSEHPETFPTPNPSLAFLLGKIQAYEQSQQLTQTRVKGSVAARAVRAAELVTALETAKAYVQATADESPEQAQAIIEAASMKVAGVTSYKKPLLEAKQDVPAGAVRVFVNVGELTAGATGKVFFEWQSTSDGGLTWSASASTPYGHMDFEGLLPMHSHGFRVRFTDLKGAHAWSQTITYVVR